MHMVYLRLQGEATAEVIRKRAMLVEEGVQFEGRRVKPTFVVDPAHIARACPDVCMAGTAACK